MKVVYVKGVINIHGMDNYIMIFYISIVFYDLASD